MCHPYSYYRYDIYCICTIIIYYLSGRGESGWCSDMTSTHGAWRHAGVRFLLSGVIPGHVSIYIYVYTYFMYMYVYIYVYICMYVM